MFKPIINPLTEEMDREEAPNDKSYGFGWLGARDRLVCGIRLVLLDPSEPGCADAACCAAILKMGDIICDKSRLFLRPA
jgi:hypothetical protein